uniref:Major sperm protein n=1 Tax=Steinernema glaseri TaxID=37863 RepID=A0A1I8ALQ9_9BILA
MPIITDPPQLRFDGGKPADSAILKLYNVGDRAVRYNLKSNNRKAYSISPTSGLINPQCYVEFIVKRKKCECVPNEQLQIEAKELNQTPASRLAKKSVLVHISLSSEPRTKTVTFSDEVRAVCNVESSQERSVRAGVVFTKQSLPLFYQCLIAVLCALVVLLLVVVIRAKHGPLLYHTLSVFYEKTSVYILAFVCGAALMKLYRDWRDSSSSE